MKKQSSKKHVAFIITLIIFSVMPTLVNAQKKCPDGNCPKGQVCVNGVCEKPGGGGGYCNCSVRPIPFQCGQICGWLTTINESLLISSTDSNGVSFQLAQAQYVSAKIYDATGRLVKTIIDSMMAEGYHQIEWNKKDEAGNAVSEGVYILQFDAGTYSATKKFTVINSKP